MRSDTCAIRWLFLLAFPGFLSAITLADGGVVFVDNMETLKHWSGNDTVKLSIDPLERKIGYGSLRVEYTVDKSLPGASLISRSDVGLDSVPKMWHFYVRLQLTDRYHYGSPKFRMILQDTDGTAVVADVDGKTRQPTTYAPWAEVAVNEDEFVPLWPGANGTLDNIDSINFDIPHRSGEHHADGLYVLYMDELAAVYEDANQKIQSQASAIQSLCDTLSKQLSQLPAGGWKRYPASSIEIARWISDYALSDANEKQFVRAARQLCYLEELCRSISDGLKSCEKGKTNPWPNAPDVSRLNLRVKNGNFHNGKTPVYVGGMCGWWNPKHLEGYAKLGFTGLSMEIGPKSTLPDAKTTSEPESTLELLQRTEKENLAVDLLVSPHYMPGWAYETYPDLDPKGLRRKKNPFMPWSVDSQGLRTIIDRHLSVLIPAVKNSPSLVSYDLTNELWYTLLGDFEVKDFREYLRRTYKDIAQLNTAWGTEYASFDNVQYKADSPVSVEDLFQYNEYRVARFYRWFMTQLHKYDTQHPAYVKVHGGWPQVIGGDRVALSRIFTANGADCYPKLGQDNDGLLINAWHPARITQQYRSLAPDKPIIDSEEHLVYYGQVVTEPYIRSVRWWRAVLGLDAYYLWVWGRRSEAGEGTIFSQPWALNALVHSGFDLQAHADTICQFQTYRPDVLLIEDGPNVDAAYKLVTFSGHLVDVLPPKALTAELRKRYRTIILPSGCRWQSSDDCKAKIIRLSPKDTRDVSAFAKQIDSRIQPIVSAQWGLVNYTIVDLNNGLRTFLLNLTPQAITVDISSKEQTGKQLSLEPLEPIIIP